MAHAHNMVSYADDALFVFDKVRAYLTGSMQGNMPTEGEIRHLTNNFRVLIVRMQAWKEDTYSEGRSWQIYTDLITLFKCLDKFMREIREAAAVDGKIAGIRNMLGQQTRVRGQFAGNWKSTMDETIGLLEKIKLDATLAPPPSTSLYGAPEYLPPLPEGWRILCIRLDFMATKVGAFMPHVAGAAAAPAADGSA